MRVERRDDTGYVISLSRHELAMLNNALNEALLLIEAPEFGTRVGASRDEVERLLEEVNDAYHGGD